MPYVEWGEITAEVKTGTTIELTWNITDGNAERTRIQVWSRKSGGSWDAGKYLSANAPNCIYTGLSKNAKYDFCLRAYYRYDDKQAWNTDYADTYLYGVSTSAITAVQLDAEPSSGNISVGWTTNEQATLGYSHVRWRDQSEVDNNKAIKYTVDEVLNNGWHAQLNVTGNSTTINGLKGGRWYTFCVRQYFDNSATYTEIYKKVWLDCLQDVKYTIDSARQVTVSWTPNTALSQLSFGGTGDEASRKGASVRIWKQETSQNAKWVELPSQAPSTTSCVCTGLTPGKRYRFCVRIHDWDYPQKYYNQGKWDGDNYTPWIVMPTYSAPKPVSALKASFDAKTRRMTLTWLNNPIALIRPYDDIRVYRSTDGKAFEEVASTTEERYVETVTGGHTYRYMVQPGNQAGWGQASYTQTITVVPLAPNPPASATAKRTENGVLVEWEPTEEDGRQYTRIRIERSVNGGAWSQVVEVAGKVVSYADTTAANNNSYRYRIRAVNAGGVSGYTLTNAVVMPPAAPQKPTVKRTNNGKCLVSWSSNARNATAQEIRAQGQLSGIQASTIIAAGARSWNDTAAITDEAVRYQVRSIRQEGTDEESILVSVWSLWSDYCQPSAAPNAPSIKEPIAGSTLPFETVSDDITKVDNASISVAWRHNPKDASDQTKAEIRLSCTGALSKSGTVLVTGAKKEEIITVKQAFGGDISDILALNDATFNALKWTVSVRTMGAKNEWSPWTQTPISFRRRPEISFVSPGSLDYFDKEGNPIDKARVTVYPLVVKLESNMHGDSIADMWLLITDSEGIQTEIKDTNAKGTWLDGNVEQPMFTISSKQWAPENRANYKVSATLRSSSGLTAQASIEIYTDFPMPKHSSLRIKCDPDRGWITLEPHVDPNDIENREVSMLDVWRVVDKHAVLIAKGLANGEQVVDRFAPINKEFIYRLAAYSDQGVYRTVDHPGKMKTDYCFAYYGDNFDGIARGRMRPQESITTRRSKQTQVDYAGREFAVVYDGGGIEETHSATILVSGDEELEAFRELSKSGRIFFKSLEGYAFVATAELTIATQDELPWAYKQVGLEMTRIDSEDL